MTESAFGNNWYSYLLYLIYLLETWICPHLFPAIDFWKSLMDAFFFGPRFGFSQVLCKHGQRTRKDPGITLVPGFKLLNFHIEHFSMEGFYFVIWSHSPHWNMALWSIWIEDYSFNIECRNKNHSFNLMESGDIWFAARGGFNYVNDELKQTESMSLSRMISNKGGLPWSRAWGDWIKATWRWMAEEITLKCKCLCG